MVGESFFKGVPMQPSRGSLLKLQATHRRVTDEYRRVTDKSQTATDEVQTSYRQLQTNHRRLQTSHRRLQASHRQLKTNLRQMQLSHRLLQATRTTEVYFQPLTWFNKAGLQIFVTMQYDLYIKLQK